MLKNIEKKNSSRVFHRETYLSWCRKFVSYALTEVVLSGTLEGSEYEFKYITPKKYEGILFITKKFFKQEISLIHSFSTRINLLQIRTEYISLCGVLLY